MLFLIFLKVNKSHEKIQKQTSDFLNLKVCVTQLQAHWFLLLKIGHKLLVSF